MILNHGSILCDSLGFSLPNTVVNILQTVCMLAKLLQSYLTLITGTAAHQAPQCTGFCRQEHWSVLPSPPPGDLPDPGIEPVSLMSPALAGRFFITSTAWEAPPSSLLLLNTSSLLT